LKPYRRSDFSNYYFNRTIAIRIGERADLSAIIIGSPQEFS